MPEWEVFRRTAHRAATWPSGPYPTGGSRRCSCGRKFGTYRERLWHQHNDHGLGIVCDCGYEFGTHEGRRRHEGRTHPWMWRAPETWPVGVPILGCGSCPRRYETAVDLNIHARRQHHRAPTREERTPRNRVAHSVTA